MKVYIAGKITGLDREATNAKFDYAKQFLEQQGHEVLIPTVLPVLTSMSQENYMHICFAMIDVCDAVFMLSDWQQSPGAAICHRLEEDCNLPGRKNEGRNISDPLRELIVLFVSGPAYNAMYR